MFDRARSARRRARLTLALWLTASACVVYETPGARVELSVAPTGTAICNEDGACADTLALSLTAIALMPCEVAGERADTYAQRSPLPATFARFAVRTQQLLDEGHTALRAWSARVVGVGAARAAHIEGTPTRWADGAVLAVGEGAAPQPLGEVLPPPDSYCSLHVVFADLEADVAEIEGHEDMIGQVLIASGDDAEGTAWSTSTTASTETDVVLADPLTLEPGMVVTLTLGLAPNAPSLPAAEWSTEDGARAWLLVLKGALAADVATVQAQ